MDLEDKLRELRDKREGAHMPHVYYGDPNGAFSQTLIKTMVESGADIIEFGIPFSDPTADGPTFQAVCERALRNRMTPAKCFEGLRALRRSGLDIPFVVTTYYNIAYVTGIGNFLTEVQKAGAQAVIVPDLPIEEATPLIDEAKKRGVSVILQVAPTTTHDRLKKIAAVASGFLYVINVEGVTGVRERLADSTLKLVNRVRRYTDLPLLAGFGISTSAQATAVVSAGADGVVVGSAYARIYEDYLDTPEAALPEIARLATEIKHGCVRGRRHYLNTKPR